ncbi:MAG: branched-chain amino acid aminotransferase [Flavobacteriales bacterium]|jgi:branched-chain amino acid aminotransferase|nr:branched-chain amino acid aminotransferase [Flavobacteriales bacterium]MBT5750881.1 branched-chain amino acid aminotransferase [Flavobacteriales bacterium]
MKVTKTSISKLNTTDFSNLPFGTVFSDHMLICNYKQGKWEEPEISPYGPIPIHPGSQVLHYGQSVFEGMKVFKNDSNELLLFRKDENLKRLNQSANRLSIPVIEESIFMNGLDNLLKIDSEWCKAEQGYSLYIRPFIFASSECVKASASEEYTFVIITSPSINYYAGEINVVIEEHYTRASQGGVGYAKAAGNYAASFYPTKQANAKGFQQLIWTDAKEHKYIEESGTMNIWFRIGDILVTPALSDSILGGITRDSIVTLAKDNGIKVEERRILITEVIEAFNNGMLKEVFGTGTAVTVNPINSITFRENRMIIKAQNDSFALKLKKQLQGIQKGSIVDIYDWTSKVTD